ncbi:MAG: DUF6320 domain-containing protein [Erysipelothrix sp.]
MKQCQHCQVNVYDNHTVCPLCGHTVGEAGESAFQYVEYSPSVRKETFNIRKISRLLMLVISIVSIVVNLLTLHINSFLWSPIVVVSCLYANVFLFDTFNKHKKFGRRIINNYIFFVVMCIVIDAMNGFIGWSIVFIFPLMGSMVSVLCMMSLLLNRDKYQDKISDVLIMIGLNLLPIIVCLIHGSPVIWPSVTALTGAVLIVIIMISISYSNFRLEVSKRLHR